MTVSRPRLWITATLAAALWLWSAAVTGAPRAITLASTTSTDNSGLFGHILPIFTRATGIRVRVVAVGTGQALRLGRRGDVDVLLVHHRPSEEAFVAAGHGLRRWPVMYNDFVLLGPRTDPAGVRGAGKAAEGLRRIAAHEAPFVSRADDSGTHKKEMALWAEAGIDPTRASGRWYRETGSGMGATLNTASALSAYTLADRGTWTSFGNRGELVILLEGDPRLYNPYGVIVVNPARHRHVHLEEAQAFVDWLTSRAGQEAIAGFRVGGRQLFFPNAEAGPR